VGAGLGDPQAQVDDEDGDIVMVIGVMGIGPLIEAFVDVEGDVVVIGCVVRPGNNLSIQVFAAKVCRFFQRQIFCRGVCGSVLESPSVMPPGSPGTLAQ
jgi:hypothetical protein